MIGASYFWIGNQSEVAVSRIDIRRAWEAAFVSDFCLSLLKIWDIACLWLWTSRLGSKGSESRTEMTGCLSPYVLPNESILEFTHLREFYRDESLLILSVGVCSGKSACEGKYSSFFEIRQSFWNNRFWRNLIRFRRDWQSSDLIKHSLPRAKFQLRGNGVEAYGGADVEQSIGQPSTRLQLAPLPQLTDQFIINRGTIWENIENMISQKMPYFRTKGSMTGWILASRTYVCKTLSDFPRWAGLDWIANFSFRQFWYSDLF
jgi:hypothetical protein